MKKDKQDKFKIDLDLTSMLDVIFIVLMVVMCRLNFEDTRGQKELEEARDRAVLYEQQLSSIENEDALVSFVTLSVEFESADPKTRHIRMLTGENAVMEDTVITPEGEEEGFTRLSEELETVLSEDGERPVLLTLYEDRILYRDQVRVTKLLDGLKEDHPNLFIRHGLKEP